MFVVCADKTEKKVICVVPGSCLFCVSWVEYIGVLDYYTRPGNMQNGNMMRIMRILMRTAPLKVKVTECHGRREERGSNKPGIGS